MFNKDIMQTIDAIFLQTIATTIIQKVKPMMMNNPVLEKVFLALRPEFFPEYKLEHVTLRYYKSIRWDTLLMDAERLDRKLPATLINKGFINWNTGKQSFTGLSISAPDSLILDHLAMPHITVPTFIKNRYVRHGDVLDIPDHYIVDTLWLGKKVDKNYVWAKVNSKDVEFNVDSFSKLI